MDLVDWSQEVYEKIVAEYTAFSEKLNVHDITFIPVSALTGDNVVDPSSTCLVRGRDGSAATSRR